METNNTDAARREMNIQPIVETNRLTGAKTPMFVAHGPAGHEWLLKRLTRDAALADGLAYFLATRTLVAGKWVLA